MSVSEIVAPAAHAAFQFESRAHQSRTALAGMWLLLATELLFFGALFYLWLMLRHWHPVGFRAAAADTDLLIGSVNTVLLLSTSVLYWWALDSAKQGRNRDVLIALPSVAAIGALFVALKFYEWSEDVAKGAWPGENFRAPQAEDAGGAHLFWCLYYAGTALHVIHMLVGIGLVCWLAWRARRTPFRGDNATVVEVVGLYWSFVDLVWLNLFAFIYVLDR